eukprot:11206725-Lingulodinium_polyedra.AAC.1
MGVLDELHHDGLRPGEAECRVLAERWDPDFDSGPDQPLSSGQRLVANPNLLGVLGRHVEPA